MVGIEELTMRKALSIIAAAALVAPTMIAQKAATPQFSTTQPCDSEALPKPLKNIHPPSRIQQALDKQRQRIQQQTGIDVPSIDELKKDAQKPCQPPDKPSPKPATPLPSPVSASAPIYVCPPHAVLLADHPYCVLPDHSTVDAIPLPASMTQQKQ
jgi:hypothetical protein